MNRPALVTVALALSSLLGGCTVTHVDRNQQPPAPPPAPAPPPPVATPAPPPAPAPPPPADMTGWQKLGERWVNAGTSHDVFLLNRTEQYAALRVKVEQSPLELYDMVVTFDDGSTYAPKMRHTFGKDTVSRVIDLPGRQRRVKKVDFQYQNLASNRRAQVELWAR